MTNTMKHSGIPWIGEIPETWSECRLKNVGTLYGGLTGKSGEDFNVSDDVSHILYIPFTNIFNNSSINPKQLGKVKVDAGEEQNLVKKGDILFLMSSEDFDGIGKPAIMEEQINNLGLNSFCKGLSIYNPDVDNKFLFYLMSSHLCRELIRQEAKGFIRVNLRQDKLSCCPILLPPLSEQKAIADYLDKHCAEVDEMVSLQEKIIEELRAYRQAIITETVTRGLNPNAPMKDSGVEWIGQIPQGWEVKRLKNLCHIETGNQDTQDSISDGRYPFYVRSPHVERSNRYSAEGEGILMAGDGAGAGRVFHHAYGKYAVHQRVYRLYDFFELNSNYLFYYISSLFEKIMDMGSAQSTVPSVRLPMLTNFLVCIPKNAEQQAIADYLDKKTAEIDQLITIKQRKIEELKEYKKSLIYEYVTGKKQPIL